MVAAGLLTVAPKLIGIFIKLEFLFPEALLTLSDVKLVFYNDVVEGSLDY